MEVAVVSDSHVPERADSLPDRFRARIATADHTIHAGDFETAAALEDVRDLATGLTAVHGNADPADLCLPAVETVTLGGVTFVVTHGTINPVAAAVDAQSVTAETTVDDEGEITAFEGTIRSDAGLVLREDEWADAVADTARVRTRQWAGDGVVGVGGHSHDVVDRVHDGVRVLNPGSVTGATPAERATMMTVDVANGDVDVTLHEV